MSDTTAGNYDEHPGSAQPAQGRDRSLALLASAGVDPGRANVSDDGSGTLLFGTDSAITFRPSWAGAVDAWNWELHAAADIDLASHEVPLDAGGGVTDSAMRDILATAMTRAELRSAAAAATAGETWIPAGGGQDLVSGLLPDGRAFTISAGRGEPVPAGDAPVPTLLDLVVSPGPEDLSPSARAGSTVRNLASHEVLSHLRVLADGRTPAPLDPNRVIFPRGVPDPWNTGRYTLTEYTPARAAAVRATGPVTAARAVSVAAPGEGTLHVVTGSGAGGYLADLRDPHASDDTEDAAEEEWLVTEVRRHASRPRPLLSADPDEIHHPDKVAESIVRTFQATAPDPPGPGDRPALYIVHDHATGHRAAFWQQPGMPLTRTRDMGRENAAAFTPAVRAALAGWGPDDAVTLRPAVPGRPAAAILEIQPVPLETYPERQRGERIAELLRYGGHQQFRPSASWLREARSIELGKLTERLRGQGINATADFTTDTVIVSAGYPPTLTKRDARDFLARRYRALGEPLNASVLAVWASYPTEATQIAGRSTLPASPAPGRGQATARRRGTRTPPGSRSPHTRPQL